ncbi:MAG: hypothetical protein U5L10_01580 [Candidatus Moranbacteria bacterium]|nr:hypothetical protein [Candidatus Moranbacteria bacterium]
MRPLKEISETEMQDLVNKAGGENFSLKKPPVIIDTKKSPSADFFAGTVGRDIFKFGQRAGTFLLATNCQDQYERDCLTNCYSFILGDNYSFLFKEEFSFPFFQNFVFFWGDYPQKDNGIEKKLRRCKFDGWLHPASTLWQFAGKLQNVDFFANYNPKINKLEVLSA